MGKESTKPNKKCASEPFLFLYMMCFGTNYSLFPQLVVSKLCRQRHNSTVCSSLGLKRFKTQEDLIYGEASQWNTLIFCCIYVPSILIVLTLGGLTGVFSKRKILFLPPVTIILQSIIYICCAEYQSLHVGFIALATGLAGVYSDVEGVIMLANTYLTCVTEDDNTRTLRMAALDGSLFLGQGLGSAVAGILLKHYGFTAGFLLSLSASVVNILFIAIYLPEVRTAGVELDGEASASRYTIVSLPSRVKEAVTDIFRFANKYFCSVTKISVALLPVAVFFEVGAVFGEDVIITLFVKHSPLRLSSDEIGVYYFTLHTMRGIGAFFLTYITGKLFDLSDFTVIVIGMTSIIATHVSMAFSINKEMLFGFVVFSLPFPFGTAGIRSHLTKLVEENEQGAVLSFCAFMSLASVIMMTFSANALFKSTASIFPGFSILLLASSCFVSLLIVVFVFFVVQKSEESFQDDTDEAQ